MQHSDDVDLSRQGLIDHIEKLGFKFIPNENRYVIGYDFLYIGIAFSDLLYHQDKMDVHVAKPDTPAHVVTIYEGEISVNNFKKAMFDSLGMEYDEQAYGI